MVRRDRGGAAGTATLGMTGTLVAAVATMLIMGATTARAEESSFRCPGEEDHVVRLGDPLIDHKDKCGKPQVSQRMEKERVGLKARKISGGADFLEHRDINLEVEEWAYFDLKNHRPRVLRFENGRLAEIKIVKAGAKVKEPVAADAGAPAAAPVPAPDAGPK